MITRVIFIYDADSGVLAAIWDSAKKMVDPENACALCSITHGIFAEKAEWSEIDRSLSTPTNTVTAMTSAVNSTISSNRNPSRFPW